MKKHFPIPKLATQSVLIKTKRLISLVDRLLNNSSELINVDSDYKLYIGLGHSRMITSVAITADGKYVISGSSDKTIKI